ncbi:TlpA family protein disulfide reductase [Flindersiella endophytica]
MRIRLALLAIATGTALALAGCGDAGTTRTAAGPTTEPASSRPAASPTASSPDSEPTDTASAKAAKPVPESLRFKATTVDGKPFDGKTLAGKPTVLWFWAAWCPKCRSAAPDVKQAIDEFGGEVNVVGVAVKSDPGPIQDFISDYDLSGITHLADGSSTLWSKYGITYQDQYVVIDENGKIVHTGELSEQELTDRLSELAA